MLPRMILMLFFALYQRLTGRKHSKHDECSEGIAIIWSHAYKISLRSKTLFGFLTVIIGETAMISIICDVGDILTACNVSILITLPIIATVGALMFLINWSNSVQISAVTKMRSCIIENYGRIEGVDYLLENENGILARILFRELRHYGNNTIALIISGRMLFPLAIFLLRYMLILPLLDASLPFYAASAVIGISIVVINAGFSSSLMTKYFKLHEAHETLSSNFIENNINRIQAEAALNTRMTRDVMQAPISTPRIHSLPSYNEVISSPNNALIYSPPSYNEAVNTTDTNVAPSTNANIDTTLEPVVNALSRSIH